jgi:hypothetical protein
MDKLLWGVALAVGLVASAAQAQTTWYVDDDNCPGPGSGTEGDPYCSIQTAIDNAVDADEIIVAAGTYFEMINFLGKAVTLRSADGPSVTIIDAEQTGRVVTCTSGEGPETVLQGFTITHGDAAYGGGMLNLSSSPTVTDCTFSNNKAGDGGWRGFGGGMFNNLSASPTVTDCTFEGNVADNGGGMFNDESSPTVAGCAFRGNFAWKAGGGMYNDDFSDAMVTACTFSDNRAPGGGGGMLNLVSSPTVTNCTFSTNEAGEGAWIGFGGGMHNTGNSNPTVTNCTFDRNTADMGGGMYNDESSPTVAGCILWGDMPDEIDNLSSSPVITYSDVQGGWPGTGNIEIDPLLTDPANGDLRLSPGSPCIDAGDNTAVPGGITNDLDGNPRFHDDPRMPDTGNGDPPLVDMGAYEFQGSSSCPWDCEDVPDGTVDVGDFLALLAQWGGPGTCDCEDEPDGAVDVGDFLALLAAWGDCP